MGYWQAISLGMMLATKITVIVNKYRHADKQWVIQKVIAKLNETLDEMVIE